MERNKSSFYNAIVSFIGMLITLGLYLVVGRLIISNYGSDTNGIISTVTQVISILTLVEAGMTLSINTYLYKPYTDKDKTKIEEILSATNKIFHIIGLSFLVLGFAFSFIYPRFIKSDLPLNIIISIFVMNIIPQAFYYYFIIKYRVLLQVAQKEYIVNIITYCGNIICYIANILIIISKGSIIELCLATMIISIIRYALLYIPYKLLFKNLNFRKSKPDYKATKGSGDILIQRITTTLYSSLPVMFISIYNSSSMASVYAVYTSVFGFIKQVTYVFVYSPQHAFGQLYNEKGRDGVIYTFNTYQLIITIVLATLLSVSIILIKPFILLYTSGVSDIQYINNVFIVLFAITTWLEIIHMPSEIMISISRQFKLSRNIRIVACVAMIITGFVGGKLWGIYGMLISKLVCSLLLATLEIWYAHKLVLKVSIKYYSIVLLVNLILCILISFVGIQFIRYNIDSYIKFFLAGCILVISNGIIVFFANFLIFRRHAKDIIKRVFSIIKNSFGFI